MMKCNYESCEYEAEFIDMMDDHVCRYCMEREIKEGSAEPEDFEEI